jgi:hypothetical protein
MKARQVMIASFHGELTLGVHRCDPRMLAESNQALVRQLIRSVFISVDIAIQNGKLYCDSLCDYGTLLPGQVIWLFLYIEND